MHEQVALGEFTFDEIVKLLKMLSQVLGGGIIEIVDVVLHMGIKFEVIHVDGSRDDWPINLKEYLL